MARGGYGRKFMQSFLELVLAIALIPVMIQFVTDANLTGTDAILVGLIVIVVEISLVYHAYSSLAV